MGERTYKVKCPHCGKEVEHDSSELGPYFPFCSERCKMVDLGKWMSEEHKIQSPASEQTGGNSANEA